MTAHENFNKLRDLLFTSSALDCAGGHVDWDERTQAAPGARDAKSLIRSVVSRMAHEAFVNDDVGNLLEQLGAEHEGLTSEQVMIIDWLRMCYARARALSPEFVARKVSVTSEATAVWERARKSNTWEEFREYLRVVIEVTREEAILYGADENDPDSLYTALLGSYEPGMTTGRVRELSTKICAWLKAFLEQIQQSTTQPNTALLEGNFPQSAQEMLCRALVTDIGYDFNCGHLTSTTHPFCTGLGPGDVRITTRYMNTKFSASVFGTLHEAGHAMYTQGISPSLNWMMPCGFLYSLGLHESQSRMWENMVGRSYAFWKFAFPMLRMAFPQFAKTELSEFVFAINAVRPSPIRVEADEVTYNLHIAFRVLLEIKLISGELSVEDLPEAFADMMEEYVGYRPKTLAEGVLQDVHWGSGLLGYYITYMLGNLAAAQQFSTFASKHDDYESMFGKGYFYELLEFLRENVHPFGFVK
ncbi:MAG: carboxypeptidase M32 [Patescibacteria group bacterium]|jgi:carboxypeptidase Taq